MFVYWTAHREELRQRCMRMLWSDEAVQPSRNSDLGSRTSNSWRTPPSEKSGSGAPNRLPPGFSRRSYLAWRPNIQRWCLRCLPVSPSNAFRLEFAELHERSADVVFSILSESQLNQISEDL